MDTSDGGCKDKGMYLYFWVCMCVREEGMEKGGEEREREKLTLTSV